MPAIAGAATTDSVEAGCAETAIQVCRTVFVPANAPPVSDKLCARETIGCAQIKTQKLKTEHPVLKEQKRNNGQFQTGTSGNPSGRPRGSRNRATLLMEAFSPLIYRWTRFPSRPQFPLLARRTRATAPTASIANPSSVIEAGSGTPGGSGGSYVKFPKPYITGPPSKLIVAVVNGKTVPDENVPAAIPVPRSAVAKDTGFPPSRTTLPVGVTPTPKSMSNDKKVDGWSKARVIVVSPGPCNPLTISPAFTGAP